MAALRVPIFFFITLKISEVFACTAFHWKGAEGAFVGKSYDWQHPHAYLVTNKKGMRKTGFTMKPWESGPTWTSKFGSLTFNQYGREFPNGGMNEAGLVVEVLWLNSTEYEGFDFRPILNQLTWVQYQLDNFSRVSEVIEALPKNRLSAIEGKIHYFVCDASADCAVVEWLKGKPVVHSGAELSPKAITNHTYQESLVALRDTEGEAQLKMSLNSVDTSSLTRFKTIARLMESEVPSSAKSFELLEAVIIPHLTTWNIVYDTERKEIHYRTKSHPEIKNLKLSDFDFSCRNKVLMLDINEGSGAIAPLFAPYNTNKNYALLKDSLSDIRMGWVLASLLNRYPSSTWCTE